MISPASGSLPPRSRRSPSAEAAKHERLADRADGSVGRAYGYTGAAIAGVALLFVLVVALGGHD